MSQQQRHQEVPVTPHQQQHRQQQASTTTGSSSRATGAPTHSATPAQVKQASKRLSALYRQAVQEYRSWLTLEEDSSRVLSSFDNVLGRVELLLACDAPSPQPAHTRDHVLGALAPLPGLRDALLRRHLAETERLLRLARALNVRMSDAASRLERLSDDMCALHREWGASLWAAANGGGGGGGGSGKTPAATPATGGRGGSSSGAPAATANTRSSGDGGAAPSRWWWCEYVQRVCDMSTSLSHETWRKGALLESLCSYGDDAGARALRTYVLAQWSSRAPHSFVERAALDAAVAADEE